MKVENVYQDAEGKWHIDYSFAHLMGLAIRVYLGQLCIGICVVLPILILATLASAKSLPNKKNIVPNSNHTVPQESVCNKLLN